MILRYEDEVRQVLRSKERAAEVRELRVAGGGTWRKVGEDLRKRWELPFGKGDFQSLGATLCHVAAEILGEDPDAEPWN